MKYIFSEFLNTWSGCNTCYQFNWPFTCITSFLNKISMVDGRENFPINFYAPVKKRWFICIFHFASFHPLFFTSGYQIYYKSPGSYVSCPFSIRPTSLLTWLCLFGWNSSISFLCCARNDHPISFSPV